MDATGLPLSSSAIEMRMGRLRQDIESEYLCGVRKDTGPEPETGARRIFCRMALTD
jgi:hypothetical protein